MGTRSEETAPAAPDESATSPRSRSPWLHGPGLGLWVGLVLVAVSLTLPNLIGWEVYARSDPDAVGTFEPLHGFWSPEWWGPGTAFALLLAVLGWRYGIDLAHRLPWRWLLPTAYVVGLAWMLSLALINGTDGISHVLSNPYEYLETANAIDDVPAMLGEFTSRIPYSAEDNWVTHVAGHPPGALLFFIVVVRLGFDTGLSAGLVVTAVAATVAPGVLVTLRSLGVEDAARRAAPFLVLTPAVILMSVSADAVFAAVSVWGLAFLAMAARASSRRATVGLSVVSGLLLGYTVMMSYGLPLLGLVAIAVLVAARGSWWPLPVAAFSALAVVLVFAAYGFLWWEAYPVLTDRYWAGLASQRPGLYWTWGNLGALLICAGPLLSAGVGALVAQVRRHGRELVRDRARSVVPLLAGAAVLIVVIATSSQMSRSEVERIWLPFVPWLTVSLALLPETWRRRGLGLQVASAMAVEVLLYTSW